MTWYETAPEAPAPTPVAVAPWPGPTIVEPEPAQDSWGEIPDVPYTHAIDRCCGWCRTCRDRHGVNTHHGPKRVNGRYVCNLGTCHDCDHECEDDNQEYDPEWDEEE